MRRRFGKLKFRRTAVLPALMAGLLLGGCPQPEDGGKTSWTYVFATPAQYRTMVSLTGGSITGDSAYNAGNNDTLFPSGRTVSLSPFKIAKYETTYELWHEVRQWATSHGYTFANAGQEGHDGTAGAAPANDKLEPVTTINWRDAIVWCNAYSEMSGKEPVYYTDTGYGTVLRISTNDSGTETAADNAVMKPGANGYRLPTEAEWEYAARGGGTPSTTGSFADKWAGTDTESELDTYAWYDDNAFNVGSEHADYGTHPAGGKTENGAGLYDMSGNVWEWCWDWYADITTSTPVTGAASGLYRVGRGGSWNRDASLCAVSYRGYSNPDNRLDLLGFRVVCP